MGVLAAAPLPVREDERGEGATTALPANATPSPLPVALFSANGERVRVRGGRGHNPRTSLTNYTRSILARSRLPVFLRRPWLNATRLG